MPTKKNKKNINQFKEALFSNTNFLKDNNANEEQKADIKVVNEDVIDNDIREKFKLLASFEQVEEKELINKALNHYLKLKSIQLDQARRENNE